MPRGGKRPGAGRKPGIPNKASRPLKDLALAYTEEALMTTVGLMRSPDAAPPIKLAAVNILFDRGHGKPPQAVTGADGGPLEIRVSWQS